MGGRVSLRAIGLIQKSAVKWFQRAHGTMNHAEVMELAQKAVDELKICRTDNNALAKLQVATLILAERMGNTGDALLMMADQRITIDMMKACNGQ
jgi:hypothetical protein